MEHWTEFYTDYGVNLQKRFFGHFLKGGRYGLVETAAGAASGPPSVDKFVQRHGGRVAPGADAVDEVLPEPRRPEPEPGDR